MRQFETLTNKAPVYGVTRDLTWQTVTLSGIPEGAKMVSVEFANLWTGSLAMAARPTGETATDKWNNAQTAFSHSTCIHHLNDAGQLDFRAGGAEDLQPISITAVWGGDAVKKFDSNYPEPTGYEEAVWREYDLTYLIPEEDQGHVGAVICFLQILEAENADARGNGSSWDNTANDPRGNHRADIIVPVDSDNIIEIYEDGGKSGQTTYVYFVGYILKGAYKNHDDGKFYRYKAILNPQPDNLTTASGSSTFDTYEVASKTMSPTTAGIYWRAQNQGGNFAYVYAREVGSTDIALFQTSPNDNYSGHVLDDISSTVASWIFGYLEEYPKRSRSKVTEL
jgi:hypothetical protein